MKFAWWGVSSCTMTPDALEATDFLGKTGTRTLFSIECVSGKSIKKHSHYSDTEKEVVLMPGTFFEVVGQVDAGSNLHIIHLKEIQPPFPLIKPPFVQTQQESLKAQQQEPRKAQQQPLLKVQQESQQITDEYLDKKYHPDGFRCCRCNRIIRDAKFTTHNPKPCCYRCYNQNSASQCAKCSEPISDGRTIIYQGDEYHPDCFRCCHCNKIIRDAEFPTHNSEPCCYQCYNQYFASKCAKCSEPISNGRSTIFEGDEYHLDCFRCCHCDKIIKDRQFPTHNSKPCCNQCYNQYFASKCTKCFEPISNGRSIIYQGNEYHPDCFRCFRCDNTIR
ncbi:unnamed protein product [Rotaria sp. Silwood1]|nr:unnamed protein product [Rotaria sp. Silwood1]